MTTISQGFPPLQNTSGDVEGSSKGDLPGLMGFRYVYGVSNPKSSVGSPRLGYIVWSEFFSKSKSQSKMEDLRFRFPFVVDGKKVVSHSLDDFFDDIKKCQDIVVDAFIGKRYSFMAVNYVVQGE